MNYITNYSKNLTTILTIFSINLYTLEDKTKNQRATEYTLNDAQFELLKIKYIMTIVDSMSMKDLVQYVSNDMQDFLDKLSESDVINEIKYTLDEDFLDEMLLTITENRKG